MSKRTDHTLDLATMPVADFLEATASKKPTPGGGSVAGVVGGLAAALGEMALAFTRGKKAYAQHEDNHARIAGRLERVRGMFLSLVADDAQAFGMYTEATAMEAGPAKVEAQSLALAASIDVPREMTKIALALLDDLAALVDNCNPWLLSDLVAAAALAEAVTTLCDMNVRINARELDDQAIAKELTAASAQDRSNAHQKAAEIEQAAKTHL